MNRTLELDCEHSGRKNPLINLTIVALLQLALVATFGTAALAQVGPLAPSAAEVNQKVTAALNSLYSKNAAAKALGAKARAVLVFPDIRKGAFLVGAQYGYGALRQGKKTTGYFQTAAASYGFQAGVKKFGYALFFMTDSGLAYLEKSGGWALGVGPSLVVVDEGMARSLTTTSMRADVYAFVFNQQGLMGGLGLEGSKITKVDLGG